MAYKVSSDFKETKIQDIYLDHPSEFTPMDVIVKNREEAITAVEESILEDKGAIIFTDAAVANNSVGSAAVMFEKSIIKDKKTATFNRQKPITEAEIEGIGLAFELAYDEVLKNKETKHIKIFTDSQRAIRKLDNDNASSTTISRIRRINKFIHNEGSQISIGWVPAHSNIDGNETADREAKIAADGPRINETGNAELKKSLEGWVSKAKRLDWESQDRSSTVKDFFTTYAQAEAFAKKNELSSNLLQLVTGFSTLNRSLFLRGLKPSPTCECGKSEETVRHFLIECELHESKRKEIKGLSATWPPDSLWFLISTDKAIEITEKFIREMISVISFIYFISN